MNVSYIIYQSFSTTSTSKKDNMASNRLRNCHSKDMSTHVNACSNTNNVIFYFIT